MGSELTIKRANCLLIGLKSCSSCPDRPIVKISPSLEAIVPYSINWRGWYIGYIWTLYLNNLSDEILKKLFVVLYIVSGWPAPILNSLQYLIISAPKCQRRIVSGSSNLLFYLLLNVNEELIVGGVDTVTEHKVVKYHNTSSTGNLQKLIGLVLSSPP